VRVPELFDLEGRVALVTGGGRGIGRHIAIGLAEAGADVVVASRKLDRCEETAQAVERLGRRALALRVDLSAPADIEALADRALAELGCIDVLVNNAGMVWAAPILDYPLEGWDRVFAVNVRGPWLLSQRVARHMRDRGRGSIVHVSSISAWKGAPDSEQPVVAYMASKGALVSLTRDMAVKLAPFGIRVNGIAPGPFLTDMMSHLREDPRRLAAYLETIPLHRCGEEDDIKGAAVFLASDASRFVTGHTLVVDGGVLAT
jgi:gluconate 5-dehydrogenase